MGLSPVAVYSECDRAALHVRYADEAYSIGPSAPRESYLRIEGLLDVARRAGADALHPGYGFLAENEHFAAAARDAGLTFIGPTPDAIALMGSKTAARAAARRAGVPVVPGVERECSIQRRHQKVVEETPSLAVTPALRKPIPSAAAAVARAVGYTNAGTIEFLLDEDGKFFYFLKMNPRLQVEHPVTEMVTGVDLVRWQIRIARGERLDLDPRDLVQPRGHAIECRIYAEDPDNNFLPSPGRLLHLRPTAGPGIRDDSGATAGLDVPIFYDPMISKLIAWAEDRPRAVARMRRALGEYLVTGIKTTVPFFTWLFVQPEFIDGRFHTAYLDEVLKARNGRPFVEAASEVEDVAAMAVALQAAMSAAPAVDVAAADAAARRWKMQARAEGLR